jgi:hypothetical protein
MSRYAINSLMAQIKVFYEPETELLTIFWQTPRLNQIATNLGDDIILFKDSDTQEPIGIEILSYRPGDDRLSGISLELGQHTLINS